MRSRACSLIEHFMGEQVACWAQRVEPLSPCRGTVFPCIRDTGGAPTVRPGPMEELHKPVHGTPPHLPEVHYLEGKAAEEPLGYIVTSATRVFHRGLWKEGERALKFACGEQGQEVREHPHPRWVLRAEVSRPARWGGS